MDENKKTSKIDQITNNDGIEDIDKKIAADELALSDADAEIAELEEKFASPSKQPSYAPNIMIKQRKKVTTPTGDSEPKSPSDVDETQALIDEFKEEAPQEVAVKTEAPKVADTEPLTTHIFGLRTTANREDQVMDFMTAHAEKKGYKVYSIIRPHGMRGYIFVEAESKSDAEQAAFNVPYARGILGKEIEYREIEHMLEQVKRDINIKQNDIVEIISGPFKRENAKIIRLDKNKEEVVVELLEAAVPIPITLRMDSVKVIRREDGQEADSDD